MKKVIVLNKKEGETPLQALDKFRAKNHKYSSVPMTYAGRLDPMAEGLLLVLVGEETKNKQEYLDLEKEYKFEILFGFATDTYDILGKVINNYQLSINNYELKDKIKKQLKNFKGKINQKYPIYSSKTVKGKPLFSYARSGAEVKIPEREIFIKEIKLLKIKEISSKKLLENIEKRILKVKGDFRQEKILESWKSSLTPIKSRKNFWLASFKISCSSGTYIRSVANSLGKMLQIPALAFSIKRTKIGKYML